MKPLALIILDGFGLGNEKSNAIKAASTPNLDELFRKCPNTSLSASGLDVGLPIGQMGNSEVGHTNIGAGRVVYQELTRITRDIENGDFFTNPVLCQAMDSAKTLHLMGLLSDGGVHSHISHLFALLKMAKERGVQNVCVHSILDGRDTDPKSGIGYLKELEYTVDQLEFGKISTVVGRYYAMDRDNRFERLKVGFDAVVSAVGKVSADPVAAVLESYENGVTDEFITPIISEDYKGIGRGDAVIFFNFRPDRAREITSALTQGNFIGFPREAPKLGSYVCMTQYDEKFENVQVAFAPQELSNTLGQVLQDNGKTQLRIAETEKYAHVTFFFNGGEEKPFVNEERILIASPKVATYDLLPQMSAFEVTDALIKRLEEKPLDTVILNFANCDMVGHTGNFDATVKAVEAVDECLGKVVDQIVKMGGVALITADHGNADKMTTDEGTPFTAHTTNPVPFLVAGERVDLRGNGILADIAPTILDLLNIPKPKEMTGTSIIIK